VLPGLLQELLTISTEHTIDDVIGRAQKRIAFFAGTP
jgi:hypothetical protein